MQLFAEQVVIFSSLTNAQNQEIEDRIQPMGIGTKLVPYTIGINSIDTISNEYKPNYIEQQFELYSTHWNQIIINESVASRSIHTIEAVALNNNVVSYGLNHTGRSNSLPLIWYTASYVEPRYFALEPVLFNDSMYSDHPDAGNTSEYIIALQPIKLNNYATPYPVGTILKIIGTGNGGNSIRVEHPDFPRDTPYTIENQNTGHWQWLSINDKGVQWEYTDQAPSIPHPDNGLHTGESYSYIIDGAGSPVIVGLKFTIDLDLYQTQQGQVFGERKGAIQFSDFKIWANNEYGTENWLRTDNDWFQLNTFAYGSNDLTQNQINQFAYQTRTFEIGDPIEETANFTCTLGFNKVPKRNPRNYGGTYYTYEYRDIVFPISWHLE